MKVSGQIKSNINLDKAPTQTQLLQAILGAGKLIETSCKNKATEYKAVDTGRYRSSISADVDGQGVTIAPHVDYAEYIEFGTYKMGARPVMKDGLEAARAQAMEYIRRKIQQDFIATFTR